MFFFLVVLVLLGLKLIDNNLSSPVQFPAIYSHCELIRVLGLKLTGQNEFPPIWVCPQPQYLSPPSSLVPLWGRQFVSKMSPTKNLMMGSYNARHIYPAGYSRHRCGATAALIRQPQPHPHNEEPEIRNRILWEGVRFLGCRRKPEYPEKTYQGHLCFLSTVV